MPSVAEASVAQAVPAATMVPSMEGVSPQGVAFQDIQSAPEQTEQIATIVPPAEGASKQEAAAQGLSETRQSQSLPEQAEQSRVYSYTHANGEISTGTIEDARRVCPALGRLSVDSAERLLRLRELAQQKKAEQVGTEKHTESVSKGQSKVQKSTEQKEAAVDSAARKSTTAETNPRTKDTASDEVTHKVPEVKHANPEPVAAAPRQEVSRQAQRVAEHAPEPEPLAQRRMPEEMQAAAEVLSKPDLAPSTSGPEEVVIRTSEPLPFEESSLEEVAARQESLAKSAAGTTEFSSALSPEAEPADSPGLAEGATIYDNFATPEQADSSEIDFSKEVDKLLAELELESSWGKEVSYDTSQTASAPLLETVGENEPVAPQETVEPTVVIREFTQVLRSAFPPAEHTAPRQEDPEALASSDAVDPTESAVVYSSYSMEDIPVSQPEAAAPLLEQVATQIENLEQPAQQQEAAKILADIAAAAQEINSTQLVAKPEALEQARQELEALSARLFETIGIKAEAPAVGDFVRIIRQLYLPDFTKILDSPEILYEGTRERKPGKSYQYQPGSSDWTQFLPNQDAAVRAGFIALERAGAAV